MLMQVGSARNTTSVIKNLTTLTDIEAISDDFYWDESGGCGKSGQNGLPVGCGSPSLRIQDVFVGGESV